MSGSTSIDVSDVAIDSRKVTKGCCFIAIKEPPAMGMIISMPPWKQALWPLSVNTCPSTIQEGITYIQVETPLLQQDMWHTSSMANHRKNSPGRGNRYQWENHHRHAALPIVHRTRICLRVSINSEEHDWRQGNSLHAYHTRCSEPE